MAIGSDRTANGPGPAVQDDGSVVVEKFAERTEKSAKKSSKAFDDFSSGAGVNFKSVATYAGIAAAAVVAGGVLMVSSQIHVAIKLENSQRSRNHNEALSR